MIELIIFLGLFIIGIIINYNYKINESFSDNIDNKLNFIKPFPINYLDNYTSNIYTDSNELVYNKISDLYLKSSISNTKIINKIYRTNL